jgi:superfamily II DNA/RNA helicase
LIFWWLLREDFLTLLLRVISLKNLEIFVLDEADRMLDMGFVHDVKRIIKLLPQKDRLCFSQQQCLLKFRNWLTLSE